MAETENGDPSVKIDAEIFFQRLKNLHHRWMKERKDENKGWNEADSLLVVVGQPEEETSYKKSSAITAWFWGYEFIDTIILLTEHKLLVLANSRKIKLLENLKTAGKSPVELEFTTRNKQDDTTNFTTLLDAARKSNNGAKIGVLSKEKATGEFAEKWAKELEKSSLQPADITQAIGALLSVKDASELKLVKTAAQISALVLKKVLLPKIEMIIDEEKQEKHSTIADATEEVFSEPTKINPKLTNPEVVDSCYTPIIQSGGKYDLKPSATSNDDKLHFGIIVCSLGARFKLYCSNVARTFFVDGKKEHKETYNLVLEIQKEVLKIFKPGIKLSLIMETAKTVISKKNPDLLQYFVKNCGFGMGLEFREANLLLSPKNETIAQAGMVFNLAIGFQDIKLKEKTDDERMKLYSILIADTVVLTETGNDVLTNVPKKYGDVSYVLKENEDHNSNDDRFVTPLINSALSTRSKERDDASASKTQDEKRRQHQQELAKKKLEEAHERFVKSKMEGFNDKGKPGESVAYETPSQVPRSAVPGKIFVDTEREAILLPIYGVLVPFHISTIKSESKSDDLYLRINFNQPPTTKTDNASLFSYIKEVTFKIPDARDLGNALRMIKELRKRVTQRNTQNRDRASLVVQEDLILNKSGKPNPRLVDLMIRPNPTRKTMGALEAHKNGLRFSSSKGITVDILYKNIKFAFFQPADNELIVLLHFHLHDAIMIGKKKTNDVQFYCEVMEMATSLDSVNKKNRFNDDELEEEQNERRIRNQLNETFSKFIKKVEEVVPNGLEFDIPYRDLGFFGVPHRSSVLLQPTAYCLVHLVDPPFFVLPLDEIEIAHFERVQFQLKNFDIVFVFKDFSKPVCHINTVPVESLDMIKEWLDSSNIKYYEGPAPLNWNRIMATIREDPKKFFEDGGWDMMLSTESDQESDDEDDDEDEEDEAYRPPGSDDDEEEEENTDDEYSEASDEYSEEYSDEDEEYSEEEEEDEEAPDWDEMEEKARREDRESKDRKKRKSASDDEGSEDSVEKSKHPKKKKK